MPVSILGIRHHGVGSAKNVAEMLEKLQPDIILTEGAPEIESVMGWVGEKMLKPPVAVLAYNEADPQQATFYPFAEFSPEWQAVLFANKNKIPLRMIDLPLSINFQQAADKKKKDEGEIKNWSENLEALEQSTLAAKERSTFKDPISYFSELANYEDSELWWEHNFEQKYIPKSAQDHFDAVFIMMQELRDSGAESSLEEENIWREAYMRQLIRKAQNELYSNIVVVCGAWHAPALRDLESTAKEDAKIIKALPKTKIKVAATWIPWTNERLSMFSGYGAGITSPGWYEHLWKHGQKDYGSLWLSKVARMFRQKRTDVSTAHVIESLRLAETLAGLRGLSKAGLAEFNEATHSVMCMGDTILFQLVKKELIVANKIGKVPAELPKLPLQDDFEKKVKSYRLVLAAEGKTYELDLRKETDLKRSTLIHRIALLGINWGKRAYARSKGTFKEVWVLTWSAEMYIDLIEKGIWGNTVEQAATEYLTRKSADTQSVKELAEFIEEAIPAELYDAIEQLLFRISEAAAVSGDLLELMEALLPLVEVGRYGNVRKSDLASINQIVDGFLTRICIGLPNLCCGLDEDISYKVFDFIRQVNEATRLIENEELSRKWFESLLQLVNKQGVHAIILGCTCRLLFDVKKVSAEDTAMLFARALSVGNATSYSAAWIEGFLKGSGVVLLYDNVLWNLLYKWIFELKDEQFEELLPILRRTFSKFDPSERKKIGEKASQGAANERIVKIEDASSEDLQNFKLERAKSVLPVFELIFGFTNK